MKALLHTPFKATKTKINLVTGFLGAGKTTCIANLLVDKPKHEKWAVIINEFGQVGIDKALLESHAGSTILREVAGGCACCTANLPLQMTLTNLLRREKPDRILIEPTGLGHPGGILRILRNEYLADHVEVCAIVCLVDPVQMSIGTVRENVTFLDQIQIADCIAVNKTDIASAEEVREAMRHCLGIQPPKSWIVQTQEGRLPVSCLDLPAPVGRTLLYHPKHDWENPAPAVLETVKRQVELGVPIRMEDAGFGYVGCGWIFHSEDQFDAQKLSKLLESLGDNLKIPNRRTVSRAKGYLHTTSGWIKLNGTSGQLRIESAAPRGEGRLEMLMEGERPAWGEMEAQLLRCLA